MSGNDAEATGSSGKMDSGGSSNGGPDATVPDAAVGDGSDGGATDAAEDAPATDSGACGGTICRGSQTCQSGKCVNVYTGCAGAHVPGDYATIQAAVTAMGSGSGGTICLDAKAYSEHVVIGDAISPLVIQGSSAATTSILDFSTTSPGYGENLTLRGLSMQWAYVAVYNLNTATIEGCSITGASGDAGSGPGLYGFSNLNLVDSQVAGGIAWAGGTSGSAEGGNLQIVASQVSKGISFGGQLAGSLVIDESDISGGIAQNPACDNVNIQNSYIHDATVGFSVSGDCPHSLGKASTTLVNNTFIDAGTAIEFGGSLSGYYLDNIIYGSTLGGSGGVGDYNSYFNDTTNYGGSASPGAHDVKANPMLDTSRPPGLLAGSPCRGAGMVGGLAPDHDYWGRPRPDGGVDIGAVQSSP